MTALRQKWSVASTFLGEPDCSVGINHTLAIERRGGAGRRRTPYALYVLSTEANDLEQGIAHRPEETSRADARLVHSSCSTVCSTSLAYAESALVPGRWMLGLGISISETDKVNVESSILIK